MYTFNKILVGLDNSAMDIQLIKAACRICRLSGSSDIYFTNIVREFDYPQSLLKEFPDIIEKALNERKALIEKAVQENFECADVNIHYVIEQGKPTRYLMKLVSELDLDLVVIGRKSEKPGGGVIINRLARRASCSLLVVPKDTELNLQNIWVPSDFSTYSKMAVEKSIEIASRMEGSPSVTIQNVFQVPSGYHYTGKSFDEFGTIMREHAQKDYHAFTSDINLDGISHEVIYSLDNEEDVISTIVKEARANAADMIIIGAKGRNATTAIFIGSSAEKLIQLDSELPVMIVRPKGKTAGIVEYLKEL